METKFIFVTGGVVSSLGKGINVDEFSLRNMREAKSEMSPDVSER